jgi:two-component system chemotaxis sensor kinase CheA
MSDEMEEIISEFITEAEESLDKIEPLFVELEQKGEDKNILDEIFRSMHTIKGAAGFLNFQNIVDVAHSSENLMKKLRDGDIALSKSMMDAILNSIDMLRLLLAHLQNKDGIEEDVSPLVAELDDVLQKAINGDLSTDSADVIPEQTEAPVESTPPAPVETAPSVENVPEQVVEEPPHDTGQENSAPGASQITQEETAEIQPIPQVTKEETEELAKSVQAQNNAASESQKPTKDVGQKLKEKSAQNLRVDVDRIDKVMDLAGEVVLVRNRLLNISNYFDQKYSTDPKSETLMETVSFLDRVTSDMQLAVMKIRMQPIKKVLAKFPRLVRDMSAGVNKNVDLIISGEGTEVDKTVIENIGDPLTHILRNSIDHGLETSEERIAKGKSERGKIEIVIFQKGNQIVIEISDDGKGLDVDKLKAKAIEKGLITTEDAAKMTNEAVTEIIFMPGFSTKDSATELSGRGVGMDVVKTNISQLNGYVEIITEKNVGTTFRICIPLTLAIIQALMVEVSGIKYAIPLSPIEETLKISEDDIDNVSGQNVIVIRDKVCPLFELNTILETGSGGSASSDYKYIIVISLGDKRFCIAVDKLVGQEEVVIKNLKGVDTNSSYVLGATITGDGKVVFILDVTGMSRQLIGTAKA